MTKTQRGLLDSCRKLAIKQNEYDTVEREGERFPRHLKSIKSEIDCVFIDIEILSHELINEEQ